jgi:hypothetical protein
MRQQIIFTLLYMMTACAVVRSEAPRWVDGKGREQEFPAALYFTGFTMGHVASGKDLPEVTRRLEKEAQALLTESIRVKIESETLLRSQSRSDHTADVVHTVFTSAVHTAAGAEIVHLKTETWFDKAKKTLYAFAYANRHELITYYTATIAGDVQQIQGIVKTAVHLDEQGEKAKARKQYKEAAGLLVKTAKARDLLTALGATSSGDVLPPEGWQALRGEIVQALARLELLVYVNGHEELFGKPCSIVANKLQAELTNNDCRLTDDPSLADFILNIHATTRKIGDDAGTIVFCYADVVVELVDNKAQESVYKEELSYKGGSTALERAGRMALEEAAEQIAEKIYTIIK